MQRWSKEQESVQWRQLVVFQWLTRVPGWDHLPEGQLLRQSCWAGFGHRYRRKVAVCRTSAWSPSWGNASSSCTTAWQGSGPRSPPALWWAAHGAIHALSPCGQGILADSEGLCWSPTMAATWWYRDKITEDKENAHGVSRLWRETRQPWYTGEKVAENVEMYFLVPLQN